jgi:hypothetical protein
MSDAADLFDASAGDHLSFVDSASARRIDVAG